MGYPTSQILGPKGLGYRILNDSTFLTSEIHYDKGKKRSGGGTADRTYERTWRIKATGEIAMLSLKDFEE